MAWRDQQGRWHTDYEAAPINVKYWPDLRIRDEYIQNKVQNDLEALSLANSHLQEEPSEFEKRTSMLSDDPYETDSLTDYFLRQKVLGSDRVPLGNKFYKPLLTPYEGYINSAPDMLYPGTYATAAKTGLNWTLNNLLSIFK